MAAVVNERYTLDVNVQEGGSPEQSVNIRVWNSDTPVTEVVNKTTDAGGDITPTEIIATEHSLDPTLTSTPFTPLKVRALKWVTPVVLNVLEVSIGLSAASKQTLFQSVNSNITQTNKATVDGYTGFSINNPAGTITISGGTWDANRLYDRVQSEAITSPYEPVTNGQAIETIDGQNYTQRYDVILSAGGLTFDGLNKSYNGADWTAQSGTLAIDNITITGDVFLNSETDLNNVTINGDVRCNISGASPSINFDNTTINGFVYNDNATNNLEIQATNSTVPLGAGEDGPANGQITLVQSVPITVTAIDQS